MGNERIHVTVEGVDPIDYLDGRLHPETCVTYLETVEQKNTDLKQKRLTRSTGCVDWTRSRGAKGIRRHGKVIRLDSDFKLLGGAEVNRDILTVLKEQATPLNPMNPDMCITALKKMGSYSPIPTTMRGWLRDLHKQKKLTIMMIRNNSYCLMPQDGSIRATKMWVVWTDHFKGYDPIEVMNHPNITQHPAIKGEPEEKVEQEAPVEAAQPEDHTIDLLETYFDEIAAAEAVIATAGRMLRESQTKINRIITRCYPKQNPDGVKLDRVTRKLIFLGAEE